MTFVSDLFGPYLAYTIIGIVILLSLLAWFVISNIKKKPGRNDNPLPKGDVIISGRYREGTEANKLANLTNQMIEASQETIKNARRNARKRPAEIVNECQETIEDLEASKSQILRWQKETKDILDTLDLSMKETEDLIENTYKANSWLRPKRDEDQPAP